VHAVQERVTPEEDGVLRRLHCLEQLGAQLAPALVELKSEIRRRDLRRVIRDPQDTAVLTSYCIT
jgi:hypothetical protein